MIVETVYIIDDDPSVQSALMNLIDTTGVPARGYGLVDSFLSERDQAVSGCLLLDVRLPGMSGLEFLLRRHELGVRLPVILITGHGDIPMTVRGMKAGATDFLTKPFRGQDVLDAVDGALAIDRMRRVGASERLTMETRFESLSPRERQVMALVTAGKMNKQVAGLLGLSEITVKVHRGSLMRKLGVRTLADLVKLSERLGSSLQGHGIGAEADRYLLPTRSARLEPGSAR